MPIFRHRPTPAVTSPDVLRATDLAKQYHGRAVVNGVSMQLGRGEIVGLLGPNGAGKTTCFYMIAGLVPVDSGQVWLGSQEVTDQPMHKRAQAGLGYLAQEPSIFRKLTVAQNVLAILETRASLDKSQRQARCDELLAEFSLQHLADNSALSLSGGERRRLEIARALAAEPGFILLDEPFAGVDPISVSDIQQIVSGLSKRGIGILITDHSVRETLGICTRAYIINQGRVLTEGSPADIMAHPEVRAVYLGEHFRL
ncbi:MAG: LPS export ABC transporter ATP-binding protein [Pseudomonadota bacterium]